MRPGDLRKSEEGRVFESEQHSDKVHDTLFNNFVGLFCMQAETVVASVKKICMFIIRFKQKPAVLEAIRPVVVSGKAGIR